LTGTPGGTLTEPTPTRSTRRLLPPATRPWAAVVVVACAALTTAMGVAVRHRTAASHLDTVVATRIEAALGPDAPLLAALVHLGDPVPVLVLCGLLGWWCLRMRRRRGAVLVAVGVPAAAVLTQVLLKPLINRTLLGGLSFPSGHATAVFALAVVTAVLLADPPPPGPAPRTRAVLAAAALLAALAVAIGLVLLDFHYASDVVAGAAVGTGVVLLTALAVDARR
jgi:membrane-associated phospholipid phosphatase